MLCVKISGESISNTVGFFTLTIAFVTIVFHPKSGKVNIYYQIQHKTFQAALQSSKAMKKCREVNEENRD